MSFHATELGDHVDAIYRYSLALTRDPDRAGDIVQDTVVRAMERRDHYGGEAPLGH